ncbi:MAG: rRNA pseudouridine synthase [Lactobacillales bacterium]|nr:rRNA pseudouridine synthase [Lactobacillales bacterium]
MKRLNKVLAHADIASRRKADELIATGHVKVNGKVVITQGVKVSDNDSVEVDGIPIFKEEKIYFLFYKPKGVITSVKDEHKRKTVMDYFKHVKERIYPVGRLDLNTSGVLLMTNDGDFANQMMHPKHKIEKVYLVKIQGLANKKNLRPLIYGVKVDGQKTSPARYEIIHINADKKTSIIKLTIHEGRNHQVKKMFDAVNLSVQKLKRERYGTLDLTGLKPGEYRKLSRKEREALGYFFKVV